jgi:hypothetical protein
MASYLMQLMTLLPLFPIYIKRDWSLHYRYNIHPFVEVHHLHPVTLKLYL